MKSDVNFGCDCCVCNIVDESEMFRTTIRVQMDKRYIWLDSKLQ